MKVLLVRPDGTPDEDAQALAGLGLDVVSDPYISVQTCSDREAASRAHELLNASSLPCAWFILTSATGLRAMAELVGHQSIADHLTSAESVSTRFAAVGPTSADALRAVGVKRVLVPSAAHTATALLDALAEFEPATAVLPRSSISAPVLTETLERRGWSVVSRVLYETTTVVRRPASADELTGGAFDAVVLRSPSAARAVAQFCVIPSTTAVIAGGPTTASAARTLGLRVDRISTDSRAGSIAAAVLATAH